MEGLLPCVCVCGLLSCVGGCYKVWWWVWRGCYPVCVWVDTLCVGLLQSTVKGVEGLLPCVWGCYRVQWRVWRGSYPVCGGLLQSTVEGLLPCVWGCYRVQWRVWRGCYPVCGVVTEYSGGCGGVVTLCVGLLQSTVEGVEGLLPCVWGCYRVQWRVWRGCYPVCGVVTEYSGGCGGVVTLCVGLLQSTVEGVEGLLPCVWGCYRVQWRVWRGCYPVCGVVTECSGGCGGVVTLCVGLLQSTVEGVEGLLPCVWGCYRIQSRVWRDCYPVCGVVTEYSVGCRGVVTLCVGLLQSTVEGVEALFKRQEDFENRLLAQEERMKGLGDTADRLMAEKHPDSDA